MPDRLGFAEIRWADCIGDVALTEFGPITETPSAKFCVYGLKTANRTSFAPEWI